MIAAVPETVVSGTLFSCATGSMASICVPSIEAATALTLPRESARSSAVVAPSGETPVSVTSLVTLTPAGAFLIASNAPLRWLVPSSDRKPVIGTSTGMLTSTWACAAGTAAASSSAATGTAVRNFMKLSFEG